MSAIGTAFVAVRPDLTGFRDELLKGLEKATAVPLKSRTIQLRASFEADTKARLTTQLSRLGVFPVKVKVVLDPASAVALQNQIDKATKTTVAAAKTTAATAGGKVLVEPTLDPKGVTSLKEQMLALPPTLFFAAPILDPEAKASLITQAASLGAIPVTFVGTAGTGTGAGKTAAATDAAGARALATERKKAAKEAEVAARAAANTAVKQTEADTASIAAGKALTVEAQNETQALAAVDVAQKAVIANQEALNVTKTTGTKVAIGLREATLAEAEAFLTAAQAQAGGIIEVNTALAAQAAAVKVSGLQGALAVAGQGAAGAKAKANEISKAAAALETAQVEATNLGLATESQLIKDVIALQAERTAGLVKQAAAQAQNVILLDKQLPIETALARIEELRAATPAVGSSKLQAAKFLQREAAEANRIAVATSKQFAVAETVATEKQLERIAASVSETRTTLAARDADVLRIQELNRAAVASEKAAAAERTRIAASQQLTSQIKRGTAATGATFLGLRGAVLSASTGFLAATVAVTALSKVVKTAEDLTRQLNIFQSVSSATAAQMALVDEQARRLGADLSLPATSATDAAEAMTELQKAGLSVNDTLSASKGVLQLSAAANLSNVDAAQIVATQLNAFGLAGSEAARVVDLLAGASIAAQGEISDFSLAFQQVAAVANQVGLPVETATAILTQFAKAGIRGSDAGTSLRTLLLRLVPTTKAAADAQAELGIRLDKSIPVGQQFADLVDQYTAALAKLGPVAQQESLTKIFGQDAIRGASISLTSGSAALVDIQAQVSKSGSAAQITAGRVKGLSGSVEGLKSNVSTLSATLGTSLLPLLDSTAKTFSQIATQANTVAGALLAIGNVTIKPIGNLLGGTDALAAGGVALLTAGLARKALQSRADKAALQAVDRGFLAIQQRIESATISAEEFSALLKIMLITQADFEAASARAQGRLKVSAEETNVTLAKQEAILGSLAEVSAGTKTFIGTGSAAGSAAAATAAEEAAAVIIASDDKVAASGVATGAIRAKANLGAAGSLAAERLAIQQTEIAYMDFAALAQKSAALRSIANREAAASVIPPAIPGGPGRGRFKGISGKGLGAGIAATIIGEQIGGTGGGILSAAGTGATFGSFLGPEGAAVGAAAFGGFAAIKAIKERAKEKQDKLKQAFQNLTPAEQRELIVRLFPNRADGDRGLLEDLAARTATKQTIGLQAGGIGQAKITAAEFIKERGGLSGGFQEAIDKARTDAARQNVLTQQLADADLNIGKNEEILLQSLREQLRLAVSGTAEFSAARDALTAELKKHRQGIKAEAIFQGNVGGAEDALLAALQADVDKAKNQTLKLTGEFEKDAKIIEAARKRLEVARKALDEENKKAIATAEKFAQGVFGLKQTGTSITTLGTPRGPGTPGREGQKIDTSGLFIPKPVKIPTPARPDAVNQQAAENLVSRIGGLTVPPLKARGDNAKAAKIAAEAATRAELELNLSTANLSGSTAAQGVALKELADLDGRNIALLQRQINAPDPFKLFGKRLKGLDLKQAQEDLKKFQDELNQFVQQIRELGRTKIAETPIGVTVAGILAGATEGLADDLNARRLDLEEARKDLAQTKRDFTKDASEDTPGLQRSATSGDIKKGAIAVAQAAANVTTSERALGDKAKADAEKAKADAEKAAKDAKDKADQAEQVKIDNLRFFADKAGNIGKAEEALLKELRSQLSKTKAMTPEFIAARAALDAEQKKHLAAVVSIAKTRIDLQNARLKTKIDIALATPGISDELKLFNIELKNLEAQRRAAQRAARVETLTAQERLDAAIVVAGIEDEIVLQKQKIKDLKDGGNSGFSLNDLFKEAISQFNQFGSNVASGTVSTGGSVRGALAGGILAQKNDLTKADRDKLQVAGMTNGLLSQILDAIRVAGLPDGTHTGRTFVGGIAHGQPTAKQARSFARLHAR